MKHRNSLEFIPFRGYVKDPWSLFWVLIGLEAFFIGAAITLTTLMVRSLEIPDLKECTTVIDTIEIQDNTVVLMCSESIYVTTTELVGDMSVLEDCISEKMECTVYIENNSSNENNTRIKLWGITDSFGSVIVSTQDVHESMKSSVKQIIYGAWIITFVATLFTIFNYYILSNAPRYPKTASMLVRKNYRNF